MSGEPVTLVMLPGLDGTGRVFEPFLALAGARPHRVIAYPPNEVLGYDELVELVAPQLPAEPFVLLGESFSGPVALKLAARKPAALRGVVLVATFVTTPVRVPRALAAWMTPVVTLSAPPRWAVRRFLAGPDAGDDLVELVRAAGRSVEPRVLAARMLAIAGVDVRAELAACPVPALYLGGTTDALVSAAVPAAMRDALPSLRVEMLEAPHLVLQRQPAQAWAAIDAFLADLAHP